MTKQTEIIEIEGHKIIFVNLYFYTYFVLYLVFHLLYQKCTLHFKTIQNVNREVSSSIEILSVLTVDSGNLGGYKSRHSYLILDKYTYILIFI